MKNSFFICMKYSVFILGALVATPYFIYKFIYIINLEFAGFELDKPNLYAGILSGIFTALAFICVLITLYLQMKQTQNSERTYKIQRFETTFFNMLQLQQEITNSLSYKHIHYTPADENGPSEQVVNLIQGRSVFEFLFKSGWWSLPYKGNIRTLHIDYSDNQFNYNEFIGLGNNAETIELVEENGMKFIISYFGIEGYEKSIELPIFDHYFRHLYQIIKFIDSSKFLDKSDEIKERYKYTSILRATLSPYELIWLFYNCISLYGNQKFKPLIEKYSLLKNIREDLLGTSLECSNYRNEQNIINTTDYPENDYDFFSSSEKGQKNKYYLSAFYNKEDVTGAIQRKRVQESSRQGQTNN